MGNTDDCSVKAELTTYTASAADVVTLSESWRSDTNLRLQGDVREVIIEDGAADDEIVVSYRGEVELLEGRPAGYIQDVMDELVVVVDERADTLVIEVTHPGTSASLGAHLTVSLPDGFDADLEIQKRGAPGDVVVEFLGSARRLDVDMEAESANLLLNHTGDLRRARLNVAGDVETTSFSSPQLELVAINSELGVIDTAFGVVPQSHAKLVTGKLDGSRVKDTGDSIELRLPRDGDFTLATYTERSARFVGTSGCDIASINSSIRLLTCGSGDADGLLTFDVVSSDDIDVELR